jgi:hypothetical protein
LRRRRLRYAPPSARSLKRRVARARRRHRQDRQARPAASGRRSRAGGPRPAVTGRNAGAAATVGNYQAFFEALEHPRVFLLDLEPGPDVDAVIDEAYASMEPGDVVVDLTGSYWCDTLRRYRRMRHRSLYYVDAALIEGTGPSVVLAAGDVRGVEIAAGPLGRLAAPGTLVRAGGAAPPTTP